MSRLETTPIPSFKTFVESYVLSNNFKGYLERSLIKPLYETPDAIKILGPSFFDGIKAATNVVEYPNVSTFSWAPSKSLLMGRDYLYSHLNSYYLCIDLIPQNKLIDYRPFLSLLNETPVINFLQANPLPITGNDYLLPSIQHLEIALLLRRFGPNHPFVRKLKDLIISQNPYNSDHYKSAMKEVFSTKEARDFMRKNLENLEKFYTQNQIKFQNSYFFALAKTFQKIGIPFSWMPPEEEE